MAETMADTTTMAPPIVTLTQAALARVRQLIEKQGNPALGLRIGVKGGGCSGLSYVLNLETAATDRDVVFDVDGLRVMVDRRSARYVEGLTLDYSLKNLLEGGWIYRNPNAARSCGCGTSFTPR